MLATTRSRVLIGAALLLVAVGGFLAFRPDKLFVDDRVDESLDAAFSGATPMEVPLSERAGEDEADEAVAPSVTSETAAQAAAPADPAVLASAAWQGIDHRAAGIVNVYEQDGRFVLRFEDNTEIQNGPDLKVWLLADDGYAGGAPGEYLDLGELKGNLGGQNYDLPAEYDPAVHRAVLIWCERFAVPFAVAQLADG